MYKTTDMYKEKQMETTMHQDPLSPLSEKIEPKPKRKEISIDQLIKFTPELKDYILANIYTRHERPSNVERVKFNVYKGWTNGGIQKARMDIFWGEPVQGCMYTKTHIVSYFLQIDPYKIGIHFPSNSTNNPDMYIDFPTSR